MAPGHCQWPEVGDAGRRRGGGGGVSACGGHAAARQAMHLERRQGCRCLFPPWLYSLLSRRPKTLVVGGCGTICCMGHHGPHADWVRLVLVWWWEYQRVLEGCWCVRLAL